MIQKIRWKWQLRVFLYRIGLWSLLSTLRLIYSYQSKCPHEAEFRFLANFQGQEGLLIDVGANAGQSVVSCRMFNSSYSIISFEPNPLHRYDLKRTKMLFGFNKFEYHLVGLGDEIGSLQLFFPVVQGVPLSQEATLSREGLLEDETTRRRIFASTGQSEFSIKETKIALEKLDDYELTPDFVKIDVQLSELKVLQGMRKTLQNSHPILIIENGPYLHAIIEHFWSFGYRPYQYNQEKNRLEPSGVDAICMNVFFVARTRLAWLGSLICEG